MDPFNELLEKAMAKPVASNSAACKFNPIPNKVRARRSKEVFDYFVELTQPAVLNRTINIEADASWNRVAVLILPEGIQESGGGIGRSVAYDPEYVVKSVLHNLGPKWALQIFHGPGSRAGIEEAIGDPHGVLWSELPHLPADHWTGRQQVLDYYNPLLWSADQFWQKIPEHFEHVLLFHLDSFIFRPLCVNKFLMYDHIGAPERVEDSADQCPLSGCLNGGFNVRSRSAVLEAIEAYGYQHAYDMNLQLTGMPYEDWMYTTALRRMNKTVAPRAVAELFSMETYATDGRVCAMHQAFAFVKDQAMWFALSQSSEWSDVAPAMSARFPTLARHQLHA